MSLNQKYTWTDFLKENPEKKELKRTSSEGKKAFESAFKTKMKQYLTKRTEQVKVSQKKATEKRDSLIEKVKSFKKVKNLVKVTSTTYPKIKCSYIKIDEIKIRERRRKDLVFLLKLERAYKIKYNILSEFIHKQR